MKMSGNTVLVTGGTSGIGRALAIMLHERGNAVIVCGRDPDKLAAVRERCPGITTYRCDLADGHEQSQLVESIFAAHSDLNLLINNAGVQYNYDLTDGADRLASIGEEIAVNLTAPIRLTARLIPLLVKRADAAIVNVTSVLALTPKQSAAVYCATKAALRSFTCALRYQLEGSPVRVFELVPPLVETPMTRGRGSGKISPEAVAAETIKALGSERTTIYIGKARAAHLLNRLSPALAARIVKNS